MKKANKTDAPAPRIFVSFLGTGEYKKCRYVFSGTEISEEVVYIQTATAQKSACDKPLIFCTGKASKKHWEGLAKEFSNAGLSEPQRIDIPSGASEDELWEIFDLVRKEIPENAKITFDVTHSFRFLPLLMTILLNYLKEIKNVELEKCYYGAWEARESDSNAPVFDLTPFFVLNDWTRAASFLEEAGDISQVSECIKGVNKKIHIQGSPEEKKIMDILKTSVTRAEKLVASIQTCRKQDIYEADSQDMFPNTTHELVPAFSPIYAKIKNTLSGYRSGSSRNGLLAAQWCAEHGMIQQGYTILQETVISLVIEKFGYNDKINDRHFRQDISGCLLGYTKDIKAPEVKLHFYAIKQLGKKTKFKAIVPLRNDINHAGYNSDAAKPERLKKNLADCVNAALETFPESNGTYD